MSIALLAVDSNYPNLALMKISAYHKNQGNSVEWYNPFKHYDKLYMSKVFSFTIANTVGYTENILTTNFFTAKKPLKLECWFTEEEELKEMFR